MAICSCYRILYILSALILILAILIYTQIEHKFEIIELPKETNAVCLDGSPYKFQFRKGFGEGLNSFLFYFEPGGFCGSRGDTLVSCLKKQKTYLGSNQFSIINRYFFSYFSRLLSSHQRHNKHFYNWNKIFVRYCDGALFTGNSTVNNINGTNIHSVGEINVKGIIDYLKERYKFSNAMNVLLSGSSAGALASLYWANYFASVVPNANVSVIADSGYVMDFVSPTKGIYVFKNMMVNLTSRLNLDYTDFMKTYCSIEDKDDLWMCYIPTYFIRKINSRIRILIVNSLYDSWVMNHIVGSECFHFSMNVLENCNDTELAYFEQHSSRMIRELSHNRNIHGNITAWLSKGSFHAPMYFGWAWNSETYKVNEISLSDMIDQWYRNNSTIAGKIIYETTVKKRLKDISWVLHYFGNLFSDS